MHPYRHHNAARAAQRGFTLYELLTTTTVVGILTTVAVPTLTSLIARERQHMAMNTFIAALYTTRSEAIKRGKRAVLCPSRNGEKCDGAATGGTVWSEGYLLFVDENASQDRDSDEDIVHVFGQTRGIRILSSRGRDHVTYQASGLARGTNATFHFCSERNVVPARSLVMSNTGRVRRAPKAETPAACLS
jgi:type IV fimbrial biogenesis protein FimT